MAALAVGGSSARVRRANEARRRTPMMLRVAWRPVPRCCAATCARRLSSATASQPPAELLRASEEQLGALPDSADASANYSEQKFRAAVGLQERVVDIFSAVPDPTLQLVTSRQLAVLHGVLGDYSSEAKHRRAVVKAAAALSSPAAISTASAAAQYELSVSALRAGDLETATIAATAACDAVSASASASTAMTVCEGWLCTVNAAAGETSAAVERLEAMIATAPAPMVAELQLQLGNVHLFIGGRTEFATTAFEAAVKAAGQSDDLLPGLCGVVARVKVGEAEMLHVEAEAKKMIRGTRNANMTDVATKEQLDEVLDRAEEGLNNAVVSLKELLGEGCPWVGAVVRRLAQLHQIKGDAIMAEGLYGGAGGRLEALGEVDMPASLRAEHVLLLEGNAELVAKLTWNGAARIPESEHIRERAVLLRAGLPAPPAALSLGAKKREPLEAGHVLLEPIDWLAIGSRIDTWETTAAWSVFTS